MCQNKFDRRPFSARLCDPEAEFNSMWCDDERRPGPRHDVDAFGGGGYNQLLSDGDDVVGAIAL
jgi:hypothetical protein